MQFAILWFTSILRAGEDYETVSQWPTIPVNWTSILSMKFLLHFSCFFFTTSVIIHDHTLGKYNARKIVYYTYVCNDQSMANIVTIQLNHLPYATHLPSPIFGLLKTSTIGLCPVIIAWLDLINVIQTQNFLGKIDSAVMLTCHLTWKDNIRGKLSKQNI